MSDKNINSIIDRGWKDMAFSLDKEMPQKGKDRKLVFWFFGASILVFLIVFGLTNLPYQSVSNLGNRGVQQQEDHTESITLESKETIKTHTSLEVSGPKTIDTNEKSETKAKLSNDQSIGQEHEVKPIYANNESSRKLKSVVNEHLFDENSNVLNSNIFSTTGSNEIRDESNLSRPNATINKSSVTIVNQEINPFHSAIDLNEDDNDFRFILPNLPNLPNLPSISTTLLETKLIYPNLNKSINPVHISKSNVLSPYLFASISYQRSNSGLSFGSGLGVSYGNSNIRMYSEISYFQSSYNRDLQLEDVVTFEDGMTEIGGSFGSDLPIETDLDKFTISSFSQITAKSQQFNFELGIIKNLTPWWSLGVGLQYSRILDVKNISVIKAGELNTTQNEAYSLADGALFDSGVYVKNDFAPVISTDFNISRSIGFSLRYRHGLTNLISSQGIEYLTSTSNSDEFHRRHLEARIQYNF